MRISYWSSDVCSSDLGVTGLEAAHVGMHLLQPQFDDRVGDGAEHDIRLLDGGPRARADMGAEHHAHAHTGQASVPCRHADFPDAALPNLAGSRGWRKRGVAPGRPAPAFELPADRKSTRLNSSP